MKTETTKPLRELDDTALAELIRGLARRTRNDQSTLHAARREQRRRKKENRNGSKPDMRFSSAASRND